MIAEKMLFNWLFRYLTKWQRHDWMGLVVARDISIQLRAIRLQRGLTQEQLSKISGVGQARISYIERWWSLKVTFRTLTKLSNALDCALFVRFEDWFDFLELRKTDPTRLVPSFDEFAAQQTPGA